MGFTTKRIRALSALLSGVLLLGLLPACTGPNATAPQSDVLSQKVTEEGKIPVTILVKNAFSINSFEKIAEEKFPQLDIIQVGNYTSDRGLAEYASRMEHDDLTDIVMTWPLDVGRAYWADRLIDLSGMSFTGNYGNAMLTSIAQDGALYYLPGPVQVRGIVYNKTLFTEKGWEVPTNFTEFVSLCQTIEKSGIRALQLGFANAEVLDTAFIGYSYGSCYASPQDAQWRKEYDRGVGSFGDHFTPALDIFQSMIDAGIWRSEDLQVDYSQRENMLFTRQCAMVEDSVLITRIGQQQTGTTDEFALMPFFTPGDTGNDWARLYMVCYIGLNKHLQDTQNKEKYDLVLELMEYISTPAGQQELAADTGAMYSSVLNVPAPSMLEIQHLLPALDHGRYAIFPELKNAQGALRNGLTGMLQGTMTPADVIALVDAENRAPVVNPNSTPLGDATTDFTLTETGSFITDAMRAATDADIALFLDGGKDGRYNGLGVSARLYSGDVTLADVIRILPDLKYGVKGTLQTANMTGEALINALEHSIVVENNASGWFYYFSGLRVAYAPAAEPGSRIHSITDADGNAIDPARTYTVAMMDRSVADAYVTDVKDSGLLIKDVVADAIRTTKTISPSGDGRFIITQP